MLVNNAGVGIGAAVTEHQTKLVDLQFDVNLRGGVLLYREARRCSARAGAEHRERARRESRVRRRQVPAALVVGVLRDEGRLIAYTTAMNTELNSAGVKSVALCPGFVDTDMSEFVKDRIPAEQMLKTSDVAEALRFLLRVSPACVIPEIVFQRAGETI